MNRKLYIQRRKTLDKKEKREKEDLIINSLIPYLSGKIGIYYPIQGEVDVFSKLIDEYDLYLPKVFEEHRMEFIKVDNNLKKGFQSIMEPKGTIIDPNCLDVIIVPMVSFYGFHRIGYGQGYYDRYLIRTKALKIGVAFDFQECNDYVAKDTDVLMDFICTESGIRRK